MEIDEDNKNLLIEWNETTRKRHRTRPYYECKNIKKFKNLVKDKEIRLLILEMTDRIVEKFKPDAIILHGSYAKGYAKPTSDVDLVIIFPRKPSIDKQFRMAQLTASAPIKFGVQPASRSDFAKMSWRKTSIYNNVIRDGFHLYEKGNDAAVEMLGFANDCAKAVHHPKIKMFIPRNSYYTIKRSMTAIFIVERLDIPRTKKLHEILKFIPTEWGLMNYYDDLKNLNDKKLDNKQAIKLCEKFYNEVVKKFKKQNIKLN